MIPWGLIAKGGAVLALVLALWWIQSRVRISYKAEHERDAAVLNLANYRASIETRDRIAAAQQAADQKADAELTSRLVALQADNEALRRSIARVAATVEKPDANGVPRLAVNPMWWVCLSTAVSRDAADTAACQARASTGELPNAIGR